MLGFYHELHADRQPGLSTVSHCVQAYGAVSNLNRPATSDNLSGDEIIKCEVFVGYGGVVGADFEIFLGAFYVVSHRSGCRVDRTDDDTRLAAEMLTKVDTYDTSGALGVVACSDIYTTRGVRTIDRH